MSGQNQKKSNTGAVLSTLAAVGIGAIAAAGAFFVGKALGEEETEARFAAQQHVQQRQRAQVARTAPYPSYSDEVCNDEDVLKNHDNLEKECIVCFREFEELKRREIEIHTTPCGHLFCANCITRCLRSKEECPTCKQPVSPGETLRIFL